MSKFTLGLDFGTESARAVLVEVASGEIIATSVAAYSNGVIDETLPNSGVTLPLDWALQNADDWLAALEVTVKAVLAESQVPPGEVIGLGIDFTSCTILPTTVDGMPLHQLEHYRNQPHAWAKLWKHHAAQPQADRINDLAGQRSEPWLARYGSRLSSEWLMPKALQMLEEDPEIYNAADQIVEGADWVVWQLTGKLVRNACAAGYKATWHKAEGFPTEDFLATLDANFTGLYRDKIKGPILSPGERAGGVTKSWAKCLGVAVDTPVAVPIIDAHAAVLGGGIRQPGILFMIMGTSTCHLLMAKNEMSVEGIAGVVEDGIMPGLFAYEAGQAGVGDIFAWFVNHGIPPAYHQEAQARGISLHDVLTDHASNLKPGENGLLALDWWNGNRSTLVDAELSGLLVGATLEARPEDIYRALIEATAFGTRVIIEAFTTKGVPIKSIVAGGGLTQNALLMQIYADVTGYPISVVGSELASALGAAMLGAVAAGCTGAGYDTLTEAVAYMAPRPEYTYRPVSRHEAVYEILYKEYCRLYDYFGRGENNVMKTLRKIRRSNCELRERSVQ